MPLFLLVLFSLVVPHSFGKRSDGEVCQSKINGMSTRMDRLEKDKQDLQLKIEHQQENFERRLEELEKRQILGNDGKGIDITKRLLAPIGSVDSVKEVNAARVAFFANSVIDHINLGVHQVLKFGKVITNLGGCYHNKTGVFVCNVSGYYAFSVNILIQAGHEVRTTLVQDGVVKQQFYCGDSNNHSNGGATVVLHVNAGESVWVRLETTDGAHHIDWESSFTGFLLYED